MKNFLLRETSVYITLVFVALSCLVMSCNGSTPSTFETSMPTPPTSGYTYEERNLNDTELGRRIREDYFNWIESSMKQHIDDFSVESLRIEKEFGIFNGFTVVRFNRLLDSFPDSSYPGGMRHPGVDGDGGSILPSELAGVCFNYFTAWGIVLWRDGEITNIYGAFNKKILSDADIQKIASADNSAILDVSLCNRERAE